MSQESHHSSSWSNQSLIEQLGNIGSEVGRARISYNHDESRFQGSVKRALELFDRTLSDSRWIDQIEEIRMARECFVDAINGGEKYHTTLADLDKYFTQFAILAMRQYE